MTELYKEYHTPLTIWIGVILTLEELDEASPQAFEQNLQCASDLLKKDPAHLTDRENHLIDRARRIIEIIGGAPR